MPAAPPPPALRGPLDTDEGRALAGDLVEMLESELVRFRHRVTHDYKIEIDRARAAMVLLTKLVEAGAPWIARVDSKPRAIFDSFVELIGRAESAWPAGLGEALHVELADFITATAKVAIHDDAAEPSVADRMRRCGAAPEAWWWSSQFDDDHAAWAGAAGSSERMVLVALAYGVPGDLVRRAIAAALAVGAGRAKTKRNAERNDLVALLEKLAKGDAQALSGDGTSNSKITALAFEMLAAQPADGLAEVAVLAFQLIELVRSSSTTKAPDPERFSDLASRAQRTLAGAGVQLALFLKRDLDAPVQAALPRLPR